ncbi:MAG TPA: Asp-tRNA(Asn)/Glu-tRNA(Gln) amidotransferase subunit GatC [Chlamydiales bacterium]|jgi:aspartyl-tRNA(Asn)/glutamyl-tRNA(Gln) amidotransferase subunit C|nr:Asp-tRNA(Asn)/Glu-tRNA(Gln) amidotransferase subunit GatC [Chlamydiales bacterium]
MFDPKEFEHLRKLCRLECTPEEEEKLFESLQKVLGYIEQLNEVDTEGVPSCNYVLRSMLKNQMREDEVADLLPREQFLAQAPDQIGGLVRVPPIMKGEA